MVDKAANDTRRPISSRRQDPLRSSRILKTAAIAVRHRHIPMRPSAHRSTPTISRPINRDNVYPGRCDGRHPSSGSRQLGHSHRPKADYPLGRHRLRDRLRCDDRPDAADGYPRARTENRAGGGMGSRPPQLSRPAGRRLSRTCSPSPAPAARLSCATCRSRSSSTPIGSPTASTTCAPTGWTGSRARPEAVDDWVAEVNEVAGRTLLPLAKHSWYLGRTFPANQGFSCPTPAEWCVTGKFARKSWHKITKGFPSHSTPASCAQAMREFGGEWSGTTFQSPRAGFGYRRVVSRRRHRSVWLRRR